MKRRLFCSSGNAEDMYCPFSSSRRRRLNDLSLFCICKICTKFLKQQLFLRQTYLKLKVRGKATCKDLNRLLTLKICDFNHSLCLQDTFLSPYEVKHDSLFNEFSIFGYEENKQIFVLSRHVIKKQLCRITQIYYLA